MSNFLSVSQETLRASNSGRERENKLKNAYGYGYGYGTPLFSPARCPCCHAPDTIMTSGLKSASSNNSQKPAWLISYENTTGNSLTVSNNTEKELKQASSNNNNNNSNSMPNWYTTFTNRNL